MSHIKSHSCDLGVLMIENTKVEYTTRMSHQLKGRRGTPTPIIHVCAGGLGGGGGGGQIRTDVFDMADVKSVHFH